MLKGEDILNYYSYTVLVCIELRENAIKMGDFNGDNYNDKFIGSLVSFVANDKFQSMFENFFLAYALEFTNDEEHKLRYYEIYQNFHDMFEQQLEIFCEEMKMTQAEFMRRCREATTNDSKAKHYIDILMSSVEYDTFVKLMRLMRPVAAHRKSAESKDEKGAEYSSPSKAAKESDSRDRFDGDFHKAEAKVSSNYDDDAKTEKSSSK